MALFAGLEVLTMGLAVLLNRASLAVALLLALFTTTYAIAAVVVMGLDVMCWRGC
ncbi:MAG: hypothetical protein J0I99_11730 [Devosia sp.]|uniref:hypothetical protein n=1 Tax=Devosia sp. TaxID=1871048 RepID=UPI001AD499B9|nr:hypothetical protein [Devosia sp.]MBN9316403.1 hypothetical protein [Devosia sp.]